MYSKYLDYTDAAVRAHQTASVENEHKDILISQLKDEIYELRQIEIQYHKLNCLVAELEDRYSLLIDQKDRSDKQQRIKTDIDKNSILDLSEEIDILKTHIQKANLQIQELLKQNTAMKRMSDARAQEKQNLLYEIKAIENKNDRATQENKNLALAVKGLKQQRKKLEAECDHLSNLLDENVAKLKNLQKDTRNGQSTNARLNKTLHQAQNDNAKLVTQLKAKNQEARKAQNKLKALRSNISELNISYKNLEQNADKNKSDMERNRGNLNVQIDKGKELTDKLSIVQASIRSQENELDTIISQEQKQRRLHFQNLNQNKSLNDELDHLLIMISEYQQINKELIDEIDIYVDQDQQARAILDRKEGMREVISTTLRRIQTTQDPIKHLKF